MADYEPDGDRVMADYKPDEDRVMADYKPEADRVMADYKPEAQADRVMAEELLLDPGGEELDKPYTFLFD